jgi:hypothetical protein
VPADTEHVRDLLDGVLLGVVELLRQDPLIRRQRRLAATNAATGWQIRVNGKLIEKSGFPTAEAARDARREAAATSWHC